MSTEIATINAESILRAATDPATDVAKMERLFDLAERWQAREAEAAYAAAMNRVQAELKPLRRDAANQQTNSRYTRLETLMDEVMPIATNHGFSLSYGTTQSPLEEHIRVFCDCVHVAGHTKRYEFDAPIDIAGIKGNANKTRMHASGSTVSYARRYLAALVFNITFQAEDDDGQKSSTAPRYHGDRAQDGSFQPPLDYALRVLGPTIDAVTDCIRAEDYPGAWQVYSELTHGEQMALKVPPSKQGPWPQEVWNSMQGGGAFREWVTEHLRKLRQEQQEKAHEGAEA